MGGNNMVSKQKVNNMCLESIPYTQWASFYFNAVNYRYDQTF